MEAFENLLNWLNDQDAEWWPFLFMRPERHERMTSLRVAALAILYGGFGGMLANVCVALLGKTESVRLWTFPLVAVSAFFIAFRLTFAAAWNRRAERSKKL